MAFDPELKRSVADPCIFYEVKDGVNFYLLVHVDNYACAYSNPIYFKAWLTHFRSDLDTDSLQNGKLLGDVTNILLAKFPKGPSLHFHALCPMLTLREAQKSNASILLNRALLNPAIWPFDWAAGCSPDSNRSL